MVGYWNGAEGKRGALSQETALHILYPNLSGGTRKLWRITAFTQCGFRINKIIFKEIIIVQLGGVVQIKCFSYTRIAAAVIIEQDADTFSIGEGTLRTVHSRLMHRFRFVSSPGQNYGYHNFEMLR